MTYQIDQQFKEKLNHLVREVLIDESKYYYKNNQDYAILHNKIFTKNAIAFNGLQESEKKSFKKYFYSGDDPNSPRTGVPFTDSPADQAFFFDQLRINIQHCTYNFDNLYLLRPFYRTKEDQEPEFDPVNQVDLLMRGVIYPLVHNFEQHQIALLEKQKGGKSDLKDINKVPENPYQELDNKVLVLGKSGQYDSVLTLQQLKDIQAEIIRLKKENLDQATFNKLLEEFIQKRWPGLNIAFTADFKITTFSGAMGISASGKKNLSVAKEQSLEEILTEMKYRQGKKLQYDALISSKGNLGIPTGTFAVGESSLEFDGAAVYVDQTSEISSKTYFFLVDRQGVAAKFTIDISESTVNGKPVFNLSIYKTPDQDLPGAPKLSIGYDQLSKLQLPLLALYAKTQQPEEFSVAGGKPKPLPSGKEKPTLPTFPLAYPSLDAGDDFSEAPKKTSTSIDITATTLIPGQVPIKKPGGLMIPTPKTVTTTGKAYTLVPKITDSKAKYLPPSVKTETPTTDQAPAMPGPVKQYPSVTKPENESPGATKQKKKPSRVMVAIAVSFIPIVGTIGTSVISALTNT